MRFYKTRDPFIGIGVRLPSESWITGQMQAWTINIEFLFFGVAFGPGA